MSEANDPAAVSEAKDGIVTDEGTAAPPEQIIQVVKGNPTDEEIAALVTVFAGATNGVSSADLEPQERDLWGHPVDKLRYSVFSWQMVTQVERTHIRR